MSAPRVAVLTVSDTAYNKGKEYDVAGPHLCSSIEAHASFSLGPSAIVPDEIPRIRSQVMQWSQRNGGERVDWIIVTGGTGWGERDVTPQALNPLLEPLPTLSHYLSASFLAKTPMSILSRPVVGLLDRTLVVACSGSKKACAETWEALTSESITKALSHGFKLLRGGSGDDVHPPRESVKLGHEDGSTKGHDHGSDHHHHHHHHHHGEHKHHHATAKTALSKDPSAAVSSRQRTSPFPLIPLSEALDIIVNTIKPLTTATVRVDHKLKNHVLAEDVLAEMDLPPTRTTNVDGYAVVVEGNELGPGLFEVRKAGSTSASSIGKAGKVCYRVNTGGPLPEGCNAVVMVEDTKVTKTEGKEELEIEVLCTTPVGDNVRQPGSDAKKGSKVLDAGTVIGSGGGEVGLLGFVGKREIQVIKRPKVAILSTGNELVDLDRPQPSSSAAWTGVVDTNRPSLRATIEGLGYEVVDLGIAVDVLETQKATLQKGLEEADIVITTGGTSMGEADLLKPIIEHHLNGVVHFGRVAMKPGKPTTFATVTTGDGVAKPVFALPGNPASALVTFYLFVLPALRCLGGWPKGRTHLPKISVELDSDMSLDSREEFHRVVVYHTIRDGHSKLIARTTGGQRSSRVASLAGANALIHLPMRTTGGPERLSKGENAQAVIIGEIQML
ncbi:hypothetical protein HD553DRAFT_312875 [Filobasidium floriforme]|uniref:uncharacterized protein n=1 Tax=Filobasidium floriforme TaxID=5210 RepID=UPI001E8DC29D|nr:uncharacterized protein HD553DRAFT_312875 [Filobasidium floriforme]KAH8083659.1 hypothetical protein HD553DRAFT_312875 [Filobasidium floriforme]